MNVIQMCLLGIVSRCPMMSAGASPGEGQSKVRQKNQLYYEEAKQKDSGERRGCVRELESVVKRQANSCNLTNLTVTIVRFCSASLQRWTRGEDVGQDVSMCLESIYSLKSTLDMVKNEPLRWAILILLRQCGLRVLLTCRKVENDSLINVILCDSQSIN